jgi:hypothetical protein
VISKKLKEEMRNPRSNFLITLTNKLVCEEIIPEKNKISYKLRIFLLNPTLEK